MDYYNNLFNENRMQDYIDMYDSDLDIHSPEWEPISEWIKKIG